MFKNIFILYLKDDSNVLRSVKEKSVNTSNTEINRLELDSASFTAQDLVSLAVKQGNLTTGQDPLRIFRFYAKRLVAEGYFAKV